MPEYNSLNSNAFSFNSLYIATPITEFSHCTLISETMWPKLPDFFKKIKKYLFYYFFCMSVFASFMSVSEPCMPGACIGQKKALDLLELKFWMVVSHCVNAENWTHDLCKSNKCF